MLLYRKYLEFAEWLRILFFGLFFLLFGGLMIGVQAATPGVTDETIRVGSTLILRGDASPVGQGMKRGMEAALQNEEVRGRSIELDAVDDAYNPATTIEVANQLIEKGIFLMLGSTGSPTTKAVLPVLAESNVPAVGFYTGVGFTEPGDILNFRASYSREVAAAVEAALDAGVKPDEVCAYVQNDAFGMAGLSGVRQALAQRSDAADIIARLDQVAAMAGTDPERNNVGPIGVYQRDTLRARDGYRSLKAWENETGSSCRFVATAGIAPPIAQFIGYANFKGEDWVFSVLSPTASADFIASLQDANIDNAVIATAVLPSLTADLPIISEAREALGNDELNAFSLEGFAVGKLFLAIMNNIQGELTRENFLAAARAQPYDIGGLDVDFTTDNQGSDYIQLYVLEDSELRPVNFSSELNSLFQ